MARRATVSRREFVKTAGLGAAALALPLGDQSTTRARRPNIVYILADDLGMGEVGCYGQKKIRTPNIDRLAAEGMRFTAHYSGSPVCAPSRCSLLTGRHTGHAYIRDNDEMGSRGDVWRDLSLEGQRPLEAGTATMGTMLQAAGYRTAAIGKWGLGGPGSTGEPNRQGFDHFFGYLCQRIAHNHYPSYLWRNREKVPLANTYVYPHERLPAGADPNDPQSYAKYTGTQYAADLMADEALGFIRENRDRPFFLYLAPTIPHAALQVPEDSLAEYLGQFPETPYPGDKGYLPHRAPRAAYAAMITRMDRHIGRVMALLKDLNLDNDTIVMFASDNGPTFNGGTDSAFFESAAGLRGLKQDVYEGGIRVPLVARWPGHVPAGQTSARPSAFWDMLPTFAELAGATAPPQTDGLSLVPTLLGTPDQQKTRDYLYWEFQGRQAVRLGNWKAVRLKPANATELYDLRADPSEKTNVAAANPSIVRWAEEIFTTARTESALFPLVRDSTALTEARGAATWLRSVAIKTDAGLAWAGTPGPNAAPVANLYSGSAGVVLFFLELHHATGDPADLGTARAGADWLVSRLDAERDLGLYTGLSGLGFALTETWKATKDARYHDAANRVVDQLKNSARTVGEGVEWSLVSDIISGTAGIGLYLLQAARDLNRPDARALAASAGRRLLAQQIPAEGGMKWAMTPATPTRLYPNFSHGTAGVAYFLATLAQATGEAAFRDAALAGGRYLLKVAKTDGDVCLVFHHEPEADGLDLFYLGWCHGPVGTARLFHRLAAVTGDPAWRGWVAKAASGIRQSGVPAKATPGFWNNVGACCGSAGVADFFLSYYQDTREASALAFARQMTAQITAAATRDARGTRWIHAENRTQPTNLAAQTGWMQGAAGIGGWYLRLDGLERGRPPRIVFPDSPF